MAARRYIVLLGMLAGTALAQERPAEEDRFDAAAFHNALRVRGLTELLELHLQEFPPRNEESLVLLQRQVQLSRYADESLSEAQRLAALRQANRLLEQLIRLRDTDPRRHEWRYVLAQSLLNEEAAPAIARIVLLGGNADDRAVLAEAAGRAVALLERVLGDVASEYERLDGMTLRDYERVEETGYIDRLETAEQQAGYLIIWACFYDALHRAADDGLRHARLEAVLDRLEEAAWLLDEPHAETHLQAQSLLLAGMTERLMGLDDRADRHLEKAVQVTENITEPVERRALDWVVLRAVIERSRALQHAGRESLAARVLRDYNQRAASESDSFGVKLVLAMAQRALHKQAAIRARRENDAARAARESAAATAVLVRLAEGNASHQDEIYGTLYDLIGAGADPATLDDLEKAALMAGLLRDARRMSQSDGAWPAPDGPPHPGGRNANALLQRALAIGVSVGKSGADPALEPEIAFNMAVAHQQLGNSVEAAEQFLRVGRDYPKFPQALRSAVLAVQLAYQLHVAPGEGQGLADSLYLDALAALVSRHGSASEARYWRFFYGLALEDARRYDDAAAQYLLVDPLHEHALDAMCFRARSLAAGLLQRADANTADALAIRRGSAEIFDLLRDFTARAAELKATAPPDLADRIDDLMAEATLVQARAHLLPTIGHPQRALDALGKFEPTYPRAHALMGKVLATRLTALQRLGQFDDAAALLPGYLAADPGGAGATLQALYLPLASALEREAIDGTSTEDSAKRAELARRMAEQLCLWADRPDSGVGAEGRKSLKVQFAEALLASGEPAQARKLFEACGAREALRENAGDARAIMGLAESYYQTGEHQSALPMFNKVATTLSPAYPLRWRALLRDLQCRDALGHDPAGIVKVIQNQQANRYYADPAAGGRYAALLQALLTSAQRRVQGSP